VADNDKIGVGTFGHVGVDVQFQVVLFFLVCNNLYCFSWLTIIHCKYCATMSLFVFYGNRTAHIE
jgi:hypothetical protein